MTAICNIYCLRHKRFREDGQ